MKTKLQHTPTPWNSDGTMHIAGDSMRRINGSDGILIAFVSDRNLKNTAVRDGDAEFIVRAVNSHEVLIKALKDITNHKQYSCECADEACSCDFYKMKFIAEQAIALAEEGEVK